MSRLRATVAVAALALIPSIGTAQDTPRTHTVKKGDTLWDISKLYLNDPFLWPEIYRVNTDVVEDPHWIYPGEVLRIPDVGALQRRNQDEVAVQQPTRPAPTGGAGGLTGMGAAPTTVGPVRIASRGTVPPKYAVRSGEYLAAPFVGPDGGPAGSGRITGAASTGALATNTDGKFLLHMAGVVLSPPVGVRAVRGDRFLVYRLNDKLPGRGQIVEPVGTVRVEDVGGSDGGQVLGVVDAMFGSVHVGDWLLPLDTLVAREGVFPKAIEGGLTAKVLWVHDKPILPTIGRYIILDAAAAEGVVTGDQVTLVRERAKGPSGEQLPDEVLAVALILRVTDRGSSAIIISTTNAGTNVGTLARLTAKMP